MKISCGLLDRKVTRILFEGPFKKHLRSKFLYLFSRQSEEWLGFKRSSHRARKTRDRAIQESARASADALHLRRTSHADKNCASIAHHMEIASLESIPFRGEFAALLAALLWAMASAIYARMGARVPVLELNVLKGAIAIGLLALTIAISNPPVSEVPWLPLGFLLLSGVIGIGVGDTAFFAALKALGPRRTLLFETLAPVFATLLAALTLAEQLSPRVWGAMVLTLAGVVWVIRERSPERSGLGGNRLKLGVFWALVAAIAQAGGATLSGAAFRSAPIDPLWSALLRLVAGTLCASLLLVGRRQTLTVLSARQPQRWQALAAIAVAALLGTYLGIWLQQTALKFAPVGIAQTLTATSPLFILPIGAALGDRPSGRAILGAAIASAGVAWLFLAA